MENIVLKSEILDEIRKDPILFGKVAFILGVKPLYLPHLLNKNDAKLTQASVLKVLRDHLKFKKDSELLTHAEPVAA